VCDRILPARKPVGQALSGVKVGRRFIHKGVEVCRECGFSPARAFRPVRRKETRARGWDLQFESTSLQRGVSGELRSRLHSGDRHPVSTGRTVPRAAFSRIMLGAGGSGRPGREIGPSV
jgi:hypothetical protein